MSGIYGRAIEATSPGETQRHGTLWTIKQWKRLAHYILYVRCAAFFDTLAREFLMLIPMGRPEDIQLCITATGATRNEAPEEQCSEPLEAQWVRGKDLPSGNGRTSRKKALTDCDHPPSAIQKEATRRCTTNDVRFAGIGGSAFP